VALFHGWGLVMWLVQMAWVPFHAAGVINGVGHWWGYRNTDTRDTSRNLWPIAIWIGGEELHNNHHAAGASSKFSQRWYEFDIGWMYIKLLSYVGLCKVLKS
jgi:stearoyl-CoA desaturase (delta-9 desaturase)